MPLAIANKRLSNRLWLSAFCAVFVLAVSAVATGESVSKKEALARRIDSILAKANADEATWAVEVVSLDTGETLYEKNAHALLIPASNMKLFTTAAALDCLGPDFTTKTSFYFDGGLGEDGALDGNLIIYGRGDPNISGRFTGKPTTIFEQIASSLKSLDLREVCGDIVGDDSYFDSEYYGPWPQDESCKWYAARVSALSFNDNCIDIYVWPGASPGARAKVAKSPQTSFVRVINKASTTSHRSNSAWASPVADGTAILVGGSIWSRKKEEVLYFPVESPPLYAATVFKETLEREGVSVEGKARTLGADRKSAVPPGAVPVVEHGSLPLSEMIKVVNKRSQNLHAELILKLVGLRAGEGPTFDGGAKAVRDFATKAGVNPGSVIINDGSGLSRMNRASAHSIVQLLKFMDASKWSDAFRDSLAIPGVDNSVRTMSRAVPTGKVVGKTGSLKNVLAFSGYATAKSERLAFSIIVNGFEGDSSRIREARDRICRELARY
jgi:D-alanyl-D-alanine carboxypeptidase/D-alanyl-D-alanine-endopeptidase (penicillin-binding protein 4)